MEYKNITNFSGYKSNVHCEEFGMNLEERKKIFHFFINSKQSVYINNFSKAEGTYTHEWLQDLWRLNTEGKILHSHTFATKVFIRFWNDAKTLKVTIRGYRFNPLFQRTKI